MDFMPQKVEEFLALFEQKKDTIQSFKGCRHLELCKDVSESTVYYTLSKWDSDHALDDYRKSEFFKATWLQTKALFQARAQAYSLLSDPN